MVLLIRIREMAIHGWWPDRSDSQLALLRHRFPRICYSTDQITMGRVRKPWCVRRVRRVPGSKIRVVDGHDDRAILLGHWRDRVRVVRVWQVFLGVEERRQDQRLPVASWRSDETAPAISDRELMATAAASTEIERWARQAKTRLKLQQSGPPLFSLTVLEFLSKSVDVKGHTFKGAGRVPPRSFSP